MTLKSSSIFNELCNSGMETNENEIMMKAERKDGAMFFVSDGCQVAPVVRNLCKQAVFIESGYLFSNK